VLCRQLTYNNDETHTTSLLLVGITHLDALRPAEHKLMHNHTSNGLPEQMSVAECHSSKTHESGAMACVSQKMMATCHAASINVGQQATQASVGL